MLWKIDFQSSSFWKGILLAIEISFRKLRNLSQKSAKWGTFSRVKWIVLDIIYHHYPPFNLKNVIQNVASSHMKPNHRPFWHFWHFWKFPWFWTSSNKNMSAQTQSSHRPRHQKRVKLSRLNEWLIDSILQKWVIYESLMMLSVKIKRFEIPTLEFDSQRSFTGREIIFERITTTVIFFYLIIY